MLKAVTGSCCFCSIKMFHNFFLIQCKQLIWPQWFFWDGKKGSASHASIIVENNGRNKLLLYRMEFNRNKLLMLFCGILLEHCFFFLNHLLFNGTIQPRSRDGNLALSHHLDTICEWTNLIINCSMSTFKPPTHTHTERERFHKKNENVLR